METWVLELVVVRQVKAEPSGDDENQGGSLSQAVKEEEGEEVGEDDLMEDMPMPGGDGDGLGASSDEDEEEEEEDMEWTGLVLFPLLTEAEDDDKEADEDYEEEESEDEAEWEAADELAAEALDDELDEERFEEEHQLEERETPALFKAAMDGDVAAVQALIAEGADVEENYGADTPLYKVGQCTSSASHPALIAPTSMVSALETIILWTAFNVCCQFQQLAPLFQGGDGGPRECSEGATGRGGKRKPAHELRASTIVRGRSLQYSPFSSQLSPCL